MALRGVSRCRITGGREEKWNKGEPWGWPCEERLSSAQFPVLLCGRTWRASAVPAELTAEILLHGEKWRPQGEPVPRGSERGEGGVDGGSWVGWPPRTGAGGGQQSLWVSSGVACESRCPHGAAGQGRRDRAAGGQSSALRTLLLGCAPPSGQRVLCSHRSQESWFF